MAYTTIDNPEEYFQCKLYTGNGSNNHAQTFGKDTAMQPNMVWIKSTSDAENHHIFDSVRGANKRLIANDNGAEFDDASNLQSFDSDGFTLGTADGINKNTSSFVAWCWKESATAGFDIVTYSGTGSAKTEAHSLSAVPHAFWCRERDNGGDGWAVYHKNNTSAPATDFLPLHDTEATRDSDTRFNDTAPTSSVFTVASDTSTNNNGSAYVAHLWTGKQGFSRFESYLGIEDADGAYIHLGFRPAWLLIKVASSDGKNWHIYDNKRLGYNVDNNMSRANLNSADQTDDDIDLLANGFKIRRNTSALCDSGETIVYWAIAEAPFVNSNGVPANAR